MTNKSLRTNLLRWRALVALALLCLLGCSSVSQSSVTNDNQPATDKGATMDEQKNRPASGKIDPRLVTANANFGFRLYTEVATRGAGKNVFISPSSVGLCLAMAYNGAEGETKQAMARALEAQGMSVAELNRAYSELKAALENPDPKVQLQIANSLWARKGIKLNPEFVRSTKQFYDAQVTELDFDSPTAAPAINQWVSDKTKGKIDKIIDSIDRDTILFLINAIYFKGKWASEFAKEATREEAFTLEGGSQKRVPMMSQSGSYRYYEAKNFQAVSLPYGGGRVSMYVFLPQKGMALSEFQKNLTAANWDSWMNEFRESEGDVLLPRFKIEYEVTLNDALKALGMEVAFDAVRANFSSMTEDGQKVYISKVKHKTFVEVNEEGTEAAAVTSTEMRATSAMRPRDRFRMVVDRPFFCAIRDNTTGTILFMGTIVEP